MAETEAEEKIRFVVTMFRVLAWPFAILLVPGAVFTSPRILYDAVFGSEVSLGFGVLMALLPVLFAAVPVSMLLIAGRLRRGDPNAKGGATLVSVILLFIAFPISTFAGVFFLSRLGNYYDEYCRQQAGPSVP